MVAVGYVQGGGGGSGVQSVNGDFGPNVVLGAGDVGADVAGSAATAGAQAVVDANTYTDTEISQITAVSVGADPTGSATTAQANAITAAGTYTDTQVSGLASSTATALSAKANAATQVIAGTGMSGGGSLTTDRTLNVVYGTGASTATQGNDSRVTGAAQKASNLSDLGSVATARTNLGLDPGAWLAPTSLGTGVTQFGAPNYSMAGRTEWSGVARLRGRLLITGNYVAGVTICTLDVAHRPAADVTISTRSIGIGAAQGFLTITSAGVVSFSTALTTGTASGWVFDGITYNLAA